MKKIIVSLALLAGSFACMAQDVFAPVLQQIEQSSTALQALRQQMEAEKLHNKTGLTPEDPEVEFGYLWGSPAAIGTRKDVGISQSFDFPTAYVQRGKLSALQNSSTEWHFRTERMQLLLTAKDLCIDLIYRNKMKAMYTRQLHNAERIVGAYEKMLQSGETNRMEYNKARLNLATAKEELRRTELEREQLLARLAALNGGKAIAFDVTEYAAQPLAADFEQWFLEAEANNPALQYLRSQVEVARRQVKVSQAEGLPKMSVGYMGEFVGSEHFQGISVGMSIPLWHNKNRVKQAEAAAIASAQTAEDNRLQYYHHLKSLHNQAIGLQQCVALYTSSLKENSNESLLMKAFEKGELTLLEYLLEMEYIYDCQQKQAEAEKDLAHLCAELTAYTL